MDISPNFRPNAKDAEIARKLLELEGTPLAIRYFSKVCDQLSHYGYWFILGTLWVSYSGGLDLQLWRKLFRADRPKRATSLMKPSEFEAYKRLPVKIMAYRAHHKGEKDWISYTLDKNVAMRFAKDRRGEIVQYQLRKKDVIALFLRRGEQELIMLEPSKAIRKSVIQV